MAAVKRDEAARRALARIEFPLRGRSDELAVVDDVIARLRNGIGSFLLVEGPPGIGKSRFLSEAAAKALSADVRPLLGKAFEDQQAAPFALLFATFLGAEPPIGDVEAMRRLSAGPDNHYWLVSEMHSAIASAAAQTPLLVLVDDLHWADAGTLMAFRALMSDLASSPIAWVMTSRSGEKALVVQDATEAMVTGWGSDAWRIRLDALDADAAADIVRDVLSADLDDNLLRLTSMAHGNPFLLLELTQGLEEEGRVRVNRGRASTEGERVPRRLTDTMVQRLDRLSPATRQLVHVAAVLPDHFSASLLGRMVKRHPSSLIDFVGEAVRADLLSEAGDRLRFKHDLVRHAARDAVPAAVRRALERESVDVLLSVGATAEEVAPQLARSADIGDDKAVAILLTAVESLSRTDPSRAADMGCHAMRLMRSDDHARNSVVAQSIWLLNRAQRYGEARRLFDDSLAAELPDEWEALIRLSMSKLSDRVAGQRAEENVQSLALTGVTPETRAQHLGWLAYNVMMDGQTDHARSAAIDAHNASSTDASVKVLACLAMANVECANGFGSQSLATLGDVRSRIRAGDVGTAVTHLANFHHANVALTLGRLEDATEAINRGVDAARRGEDTVIAQNFVHLTAMCAVIQGKLDEARSAVESLPDGVRFMNNGVSGLIHVFVLSELAARTEDRNLARIAGLAADYLMDRGPARRRAACGAQAFMAWQQGDAVRAADAFERGGELLGTPLLALDLDHTVLAARVAAGANGGRLHELVASAIRNLETDSDIPLFAAVSMHARALLDDDAASLGAAVDAYAGCERPLLLAAAVEDLGVALAKNGDAQRAAAHLSDAFDAFSHAQSTADARRVARALADLGVHRRIVRVRESTGWESLTRMEWRVVELVAEGATNREVAEYLSLSPHTVNTHLRNIFAKLRIRSREKLRRSFRATAGGDDAETAQPR
ncbi:ATP/maltotriose-dependent transcriptional regulator MalT [Mycolicibacterium sp. BK634]|uniref:ATP-binding protein n=1 Tax=Mycolicibacterium sp. BK634 TaxID=2587099 RepID=UPI00160A9FAD|nr:LuxR family transcriptional regulator [Mycolicibacterium sp. BK634]MBB3750402.1 ATP/maltotriose-dependent transcriptional regulator MalT [Mycolicibacterium sp. BK634]